MTTTGIHAYTSLTHIIFHLIPLFNSVKNIRIIIKLINLNILRELKVIYIAEMKVDRVISKFPKPFCQEMSPYKELEFSETVKLACSSFLPIDSSPRMSKVIILGDLGVGKTSLVNRFCHQIYNYNYKATIGVDFEIERFSILKVPFDMQLWDTAGQERFKCIASAYYRSSHAIITVFDLGSLSSLKHCVTWLKEALDSNIEEPLKFLVGTKRDLVSDTLYRSVEKEAGEFAKLMRAEYWAVSSKTGSYVTELFQRVAALSFEYLMKSDLESSPIQRSIKLGHNLTQAKKETKARKKDIQCNVRVCTS